MKKTFKIIIPLALIFLGTTASAQDMKMSKEDRMEHRQEKFEEMKSELNLSDEQAEQVESLMRERKQLMKENRIPKEKLEAMSEEEQKKVKMEQMRIRKEGAAEMRAEMMEILNEEQLEKFDAMMEERKGKMKEKKMMHQHKHKAGEDHSHE